MAKDFLADAVARNMTITNSIHADRGGSMNSNPVSELRVDLGICGSHSRPRTSNDTVQALVVVDRHLPERPDTPERRYLDECTDRLPTHMHVNDRLWIPMG